MILALRYVHGWQDGYSVPESGMKVPQKFSDFQRIRNRVFWQIRQKGKTDGLDRGAFEANPQHTTLCPLVRVSRSAAQRSAWLS